MSGNHDAPPPAEHNVAEYSVGELSLAIKHLLEGGFERVRVRGEISGYKRAASGHLYMNLKDEAACLKAVCWRGQAARLGLEPADGMEVIAVGRLTTYGERSEYQLVVERMELAGIGALLKLIEDRRRKLAAEGLFDAARKRPLPLLPEVIGIVTSPTGAVIRDILHRLADRFPRRVLLWPVPVQGEGAAEKIAAAIHGFNAFEATGILPRPHLLILARGGGSIEDLMAFNEESVVRAAAASMIPLISAIGHETDTTLVDFAADHRAPTPSAAAERAVPVRADLLRDLSEGAHRLAQGALRRLHLHRVTLDHAARALPHPRRRIEEKAQSLDHCLERWEQARRGFFQRRQDLLLRLAAGLPTPAQRLAHAQAQIEMTAASLQRAAHLALERKSSLLARGGAGFAPRLFSALLQRKTAALAHSEQLLESYSYARVLKRGFALVRDAAGDAIASAAGIAAGQSLRLQFHDGEVAASAGDKERKRPPAAKKERQGSLL